MTMTSINSGYVLNQVGALCGGHGDVLDEVMSFTCNPTTESRELYEDCMYDYLEQLRADELKRLKSAAVRMQNDRQRFHRGIEDYYDLQEDIADMYYDMWRLKITNALECMQRYPRVDLVTLQLRISDMYFRDGPVHLDE